MEIHSHRAVSRRLRLHRHEGPSRSTLWGVKRGHCSCCPTREVVFSFLGSLHISLFVFTAEATSCLASLCSVIVLRTGKFRQQDGPFTLAWPCHTVRPFRAPSTPSPVQVLTSFVTSLLMHPEAHHGEWGCWPRLQNTLQKPSQQTTSSRNSSTLFARSSWPRLRCCSERSTKKTQ